MYSLIDKYHFRNYVRKIGFNLGLEINSFNEDFNKVCYNIYGFEENFPGFLHNLNLELTKTIRVELGKKNDIKDYLSFINNELVRLEHELEKISELLLDQPNFDKDHRSIYNIDIFKFGTIYSYALAKNKFVEVYKGNANLSQEFKDFIELHQNKTGIYFLYNKDKELVYIGKSKNLGIRALGSIRVRGAYYLKLALTSTGSDMHIYEPYYILKLKPALNVEFQEYDDLKVALPQLETSKLVAIYELS